MSKTRLNSEKTVHTSSLSKACSILLSSALLAVCWASARADVQNFAPESCDISAGKFDLNDVSFLYPLPASARDFDDLISMRSAGLGGDLVPQVAFDDFFNTTSSENVEASRLVAARVDHCFPGDNGEGCIKQLRLVFQPVLEDADTGVVTTADTNVHTFYTFDDETFERLLHEFKNLKSLAGTATACKPLTVHPVMQQEGLKGAYAQKLKEIITRFAGEENFDHSAQSFILDPTTATTTRIFKQQDAAGNGIPIAGPNSRGGHVSAAVAQNNVLVAMPMGPFQTRTELLWRLQNNTLFNGRPSQEEIENAVDETFILDNPLLSNAKTTDCFSCHLAGRVRPGIVNNTSISLPDFVFANEYKNPAFDLTPTFNGLNIEQEKMFSYTMHIPSVNPRVIHESAEVAEALNRWQNPSCSEPR